MMVMCISWMRAVALDGTRRTCSAACASRPPPAPVSAQVEAPRSRAAAMPRTTFSAPPDVLMPTTTSAEPAESLDLAGEHIRIAVVVGDGGQHGGVRGQGDRRQGSSIALVVPRQLAGEVLCVGGASAIAEHDEFATLSKAAMMVVSQPGDGGKQSLARRGGDRKVLIEDGG